MASVSHEKLVGMPPSPVLLVEDDPDIVLALSDLLTEAGFDVRSATDGRRATELLDSLPRPCLVLLDQHMPVMTGSELLDGLARRPDSHDFRVILMSAGTDAAHLQAHPLVRGHVRKPFSIDQVVRAMKAALP